MARSPAQILPILLLVVAGVFVFTYFTKPTKGAEPAPAVEEPAKVAKTKAPAPAPAPKKVEPTAEAKAPAPAPAAKAPAPAVTAAPKAAAPAPKGVQGKVLKFLKDVKYTGAIGASGFAGAAAYKLPAGHALKVGAKSTKSGLTVDTSMFLKGKGAAPNLELTTVAELVDHPHPGAWMDVHEYELSSTKYKARLSKAIAAEGKPEVSAVLSNEGVSAGVSFEKPVTDDLDLIVGLDMPYSFKSKKVDPSLSADAAYKVRGGKVVGSFTAKSSTGLKGSQVTATYDI